MTEANGATETVRALEGLGCRKIFGIPGIHNLDIYDALLDSSITHVTARNEAGAGFMAMGYAQRYGVPGYALVISGPGLTNSLTALGEAFHDSVPLVLISSQIPSGLLERRTGYLHELRESIGMTSSVTKASFRVERLEEIPQILSLAHERSCSGRPGPVHVEIPLDVLRASGKGSVRADDLSAAARLLENAKRIAVVAGGGAVDASEEVTAFAERLKAPVITTAAGKGVCDERHPLSLGGRLHLPVAQAFLQNMDAVVAVGTQLSTTDTWLDGALKLPSSVVAINVDAGDLERNLRCSIGICADAGAGLAALNARLPERQDDDVPRIVEQVRAQCDRQAAEVTGAGGSFERQRALLLSLREALGQNGALFTDMTGLAYTALSEWPAYRTRSFFHPVGFGTLGYALPAALGAAAADPGGGTCVMTGDGGLQFTLQELAVARDLALPLPIIVWNDHGYGEIRKSEDQRHPGQRIAVDHPAPELQALAGAYQMHYKRAVAAAELKEAVERALAATCPTIIEVPAVIEGGE